MRSKFLSLESKVWAVKMHDWEIGDESKVWAVKMHDWEIGDE